ncbi:Ataxin-10 [Stylophora pistillata]|uniref:Ataxin-10 n=1 Tax=Stylophora pistillata TaxID=50429 RepID=A0A2B4SYQ0_STYPI|nr:Ataxin-10 [Stylophora pistillata]
MADGESTLTELGALTRKLDCSQNSWTEVKTTLEKFKTWAVVEENRCMVSETNILQIKDIITACKNCMCAQKGEVEENKLIPCLKALTEAFRFLRNCCAATPKNQNSVVSLGVVEEVLDSNVLLLKPKFQENEGGSDVVSDAIKSSLQLLGNTVVKNNATQQFVWNKCFPNFFLSVMSSANHNIQDCLCMIIYNCLKEQYRFQLVSAHDGLKIITHVIHLCAEKSQLEWGYFILDYLICNASLPEIYKGIEFDPLARDQVCTPRALRYSVPQGSILGPLLFTLYIACLQDVIARHNLDSLFYADDTQLYSTIDPANQAPSMTALQTCIEDVMRWNTQNMLRSNAEKTEVILFTSRFTKSPNIEKLFFDSTIIELTEKVHDLGVILDKILTLTYHNNETCRKATNAIRSIRCICKYLTNENLKLLVNALVISGLDYCNSILYGLPKRELNKVQRVQNTAARLITRSKQYDHIKPVLQKLHWLPVESRIMFKVIVISFKILHGLSLVYLSSLLQEYYPPRTLCSSSKSLLTVPTINSVTYGELAVHKDVQMLADIENYFWIILLDLIQVKITDALDEPSLELQGEHVKHDFCKDSLAYIADEFAKQAENITQQLQQLSPSSDDFGILRRTPT